MNNQRYEVGCAGEFVHALPTEREALVFAQGCADVTGRQYEVMDAQTHAVLHTIEPLKAA